MQLVAELVDRNPVPNGGQRVLEHAALAAVHMNVASRDQRNRKLEAERSRLAQSAPVVARVQELYGDP